MLRENLTRLRKAKGLSQEELAQRLHVVRQTVSKWEKGLSVPDSEMLIELSRQLEVPVSVLLGETVEAPEAAPDEQQKTIAELAESLAAINEQLAQSAERKRRLVRIVSIVALIGSAGYLLAEIGIWLCAELLPISVRTSASIGVIGGADGPTSILVTGSPGGNIFTILLAAVVLGLAIYGLRSKRAG